MSEPVEIVYTIVVLILLALTYAWLVRRYLGWRAEQRRVWQPLESEWHQR